MLESTTVEASSSRVMVRIESMFILSYRHTLSNFDVHSLVVSNGGHHWTHEFQKDDERLMSFNFLAPPFWVVNKPLHDFWVLARVDGQHSASQKWTIFFCYGFVLVLWVNILKNLLWSQGFSIVVVALNPQPWSVVVFVIWNINVVFPKVFLSLFIVILSTDLYKPVFISFLTFKYLLLREVLNSLRRGGWAK